MEHAINWFQNLKGRVTYSMVYRNGPNSYDCSSAEYYSLIAAGIFPKDIRIGNTDSLYNDLERHGFVKVASDANGNVAARRGDIFLWGVRGASGGASGHTGTFVNENDIIHCNFGYNGITVNNHDLISSYNGWPNLTVYRYNGAPYTPPSIPGSPDDQLLDVGSWIKFDKIYTANDVQLIDGIWQVRCNELCKNNFTWVENGIPAEPLVEVDGEYRTDDQELDIGSRFKLPGKYQVLDLGETDGMWLALIEWNGLKFWVDVETATEISGSASGSSTPGTRPTPKPVQPETPKPVEPKPEVPQPTEPKPTQPKPEVPKPSEPTTEPPKEPIVTNPPIKTNPKEDNMAFSPKDQEQLKIANERAKEEFAKTNMEVKDMNKQSLINGIYMFLRSFVIVMIPVLLNGVNTGQMDWTLVGSTAIGALLLGLDKFLHDNPKIPFNGITGF